MDSESRSLSLPVRIVAVLIASLLILPVLIGLVVTASGTARGAWIGVLGFLIFFGGVVGALAWMRRRSDVQHDHDEQWGPRPRSPW